MKVTKSVELSAVEVVTAIRWYLIRKGELPKTTPLTGATVHNQGDEWIGMRIQWVERDDSTEPNKTKTNLNPGNDAEET